MREKRALEIKQKKIHTKQQQQKIVFDEKKTKKAEQESLMLNNKSKKKNLSVLQRLLLGFGFGVDGDIFFSLGRCSRFCFLGKMQAQRV